MILIGALVFITSLSAPVAPSGADSVAAARRVAASAQLAAQEYRVGVVGNRVVMPAEVEEAELFLREAVRTARTLPVSVSATAVTGLERALSAVRRTVHPDSVDLYVRAVTGELASVLRITLVDIPVTTPSLARGAEVFARECAGCHGSRGRGDGPAGRMLMPVPANLADHAALTDATPLAFYQRITIGVAGTAMPAYESRLSAEDRWAVAAYASTLRQHAPGGVVPASLRSFPVVAELSDSQVLAALGAGADRAGVGAVRGFQDVGDSGDEVAAAFGAVRARLRQASDLAAAGRAEEATAAAFDAYLAFERVERTVRAKKPELAARLEAAFASLRARTSGGTAGELAAVQADLAADLEQAERVVADKLSPINLFVQSLVILLREGLEAILIIGALMTFLVKTGAPERRRDIHIGVGAAVALSVLTAVLLETVFQLSPAHREAMEGFTLVAAVGVLFYVSYWLLSKMEVAKWTAFVREKVQVAVTGGSALALASAAFLAVYREGFETVLFYKALFVSGGSAGGTFWPVVGGMAVGGLLLAGVYTAMNRYGVRLPLKPFFAVTSGFLYYTAFVFAGKAVAELQAGGVMGTTVLQGWPRLPVLGVYPTVESMLAQAVLLVLAAAALGWVLVVQRRRDERQFAEAAVAASAMPIAAASATVEGLPLEGAVLPSLEQMEADLAALKAEVEVLRNRMAGAALNR